MNRDNQMLISYKMVNLFIDLCVQPDSGYT